MKPLSQTIMFILLFISSPLAQASKVNESANDQIQAVLMNYINGTSYSRIEQIEKAFHPQANLLLEKKDTPFWRVPIKEYVSWFSDKNPGEFTGRIGEILSIDVDGNVATAKVEIFFPKRKIRYVDMFLLKNISGQWQIISKTAAKTEANNHGKRILFIVSNAHFHGNSNKAAGVSFSEIIKAYQTFKQAGYTVDFVSPEGGAIPLSYINTSDPLHKDYIYNSDFMYALANTKSPSQIEPAKYSVVHYVGGSNAMYGVAENEAIQHISMTIYEEHNGIISSVCHGTAGIVNLKTKDGKYLVEGKRITGYPEAYEQKGADYFKQFPLLIQATIEQHKGSFHYAARNNPHVEVDGRVITGQNHLSSSLVAERIIEMLANQG